jgi:hypothetical protein
VIDITGGNTNCLIIAGKIPGAWLVQIKDVSHAVMSQYPNEINRVLQTFLSSSIHCSYIVGSIILEDPKSKCCKPVLKVFIKY